MLDLLLEPAQFIFGSWIMSPVIGFAEFVEPGNQTAMFLQPAGYDLETGAFHVSRNLLGEATDNQTRGILKLACIRLLLTK